MKINLIMGLYSSRYFKYKLYKNNSSLELIKILYNFYILPENKLHHFPDILEHFLWRIITLRVITISTYFCIPHFFHNFY